MKTTKMENKCLGIVEGFFSCPLPLWKNKERITLIKFLAQQTKFFNFYLYAPKDDSLVTQDWERLYPQDKIKNLQKVLETCNQLGVSFCYGLNPDFIYKPGAVNKTALKINKKLSQLAQIGVSSFCLLFDDTPFAYEILGGKRDKKEAYDIGKIQCQLANQALSRLSRKYPLDNFLFCPSDYFFVTKTPYLEAISEALDPKIKIIWTGPGVYTPQLKRQDIGAAQRVLGEQRQIIWWNNYPVNDCEHLAGTFNLGGFNPPQLDVIPRLAGILINPMREAYANFPNLLTFAMFLENPQKYKREKAFEAALIKLLGEKKAQVAKEIMREFSARNLIDNEDKFLLKPLRKKQSLALFQNKIKKLKQDIDWFEKTGVCAKKEGELFSQTVLPSLLEKAQCFISSSKFIIKKQIIPSALIGKLSLFPVSWEKKYLSRINKILLLQMRLDEKAAGVKEQLDNLTPTNIKQAETLRLKEEAQFAKIVNDVKISPRTKLLLLSSRCNLFPNIPKETTKLLLK